VKKNLLVLALSLVSVSAVASPDMVKMTPEKFATYQKGIREMFKAAYDASTGQGCGIGASSTLNAIYNSSEGYLDANSAQPVVVFVQNPLASREGDTKITISIRTGSSFKTIASSTIEKTIYKNQLVNNDVRSLQYGIVPNVTSETCSLVPAANPTNPTK
jgi:hypothetical protein